MKDICTAVNKFLPTNEQAKNQVYLPTEAFQGISMCPLKYSPNMEAVGALDGFPVLRYRTDAAFVSYSFCFLFLNAQRVTGTSI